jgi:hypothetical protein
MDITLKWLDEDSYAELKERAWEARKTVRQYILDSTGLKEGIRDHGHKRGVLKPGKARAKKEEETA